VHDAVAQDLAFLRMRLPLLEQAIGERDNARAAAYLADLRDALGRAHGSLREIVNDLRTPSDPQGLGHAIRTRVDEFAARSGIAVRLDNLLPGLTLPGAHEAQLLHILGEALSNIERHSRARQVSVSLGTCAAGIELLIADDGSGLDSCGQPPGSGHHGLAIMAERAARIGGQLSVRGREGGGTVVALAFTALPSPVDLHGKAA
jgi:two-component system nitrate/nitrite sensor histidine kinase NarX